MIPKRESWFTYRLPVGMLRWIEERAAAAAAAKLVPVPTKVLGGGSGGCLIKPVVVFVENLHCSQVITRS